MNWPTTLLSLGAVFLLANPALSDPTLTSATHETFLKRVDAALASREPRQIAAVSDTKSWREAGYPRLDALKMILPKGPLIRDGNLSDTSVLYKDAAGRSWRLTLQHDAERDAWLAVIRPHPCPRGGCDDVQAPDAKNPDRRLRHGPSSSAGRSPCKRLPN